MIARRLLAACILTLVGGLVHGVPAQARDVEDAPAQDAPRKNFSNLWDSTDWVVKAFEHAEAAAARGEWAPAVRALQEVIDETACRETQVDAAPYVRAVGGSAVYEGAWIVARHRIQRWGPPALEVYAREFGSTALAAVERAATRRDRALLGQAARRFLGLPGGRRAALLLVDLAIEAGDIDGALGQLEDLVDLEAVSRESPEALAPWRAARVHRQALLLARDAAARPAVEEALATADPASESSVDALPASLLRARPPTARWLTTGGDASRAAVAPTLGHDLVLSWFRGPSPADDLVDTRDPRRRSQDRPSVWLPPRAVSSDDHLLVSDGQYLHIYDLRDGSRVLDRELCEYPGTRRGGIGQDTEEDRRRQFGLLEGHALTIHPVAGLTAGGARLGRGWLVLAAVPDGRAWDWDRARGSGHSARDDRIQAFHWDGRTLTTLWRAGGTPAGPRKGLETDTRLYGAPVVYAGLVWVGGIRPAKATQDRWEAWVFGLDPETGEARVRTHLGTGTPMRTGRMDEVIPTSPAAARGRVVVGTSLGILAAVDAQDGRVRWAYRYSRAVETERGRVRNRDRRDDGARASTFSNEPPILAGDHLYATPTDGHELLVLYNRPLTRERALRILELDRMALVSTSQVEHVAGVVLPRADREGSLALVCQGDEAEIPGALVGVYALRGRRGEARADHAPRWPLLEDEFTALWKGIAPTGYGAQPYGRALVTETEVFVSQEHGIAVFELVDRGGDGNLLALLDMSRVPKPLRAGMRGRPYGNLIPVPGGGLVAVNATSIACWRPK